MYKRRRLHQPTLPRSASEVPQIISTSRFAANDDAPFYRGSVEFTEGSAVYFATAAQVDLMKTADKAFIDGTFFTVPRLYYQLFTVFVSVECYVFPVFFCLMTGKARSLYVKIFEKLHELVPEFSPTTVMADFENASVDAMKTVFGHTLVVHGCWFHFAQAVVKYCRKIGLAVAYKSNDVVRRCIRCLTCLPLLPEDAIEGAVADLETFAITVPPVHVESIKKLFRYVRRQWLQSVGAQRLSVAGLPDRTNNGVENFHKQLKMRVKVSHPNLFVFLDHLRNLSVDLMLEVSRLRQHRRIRRIPRRRQKNNDKRIRESMEKYSSGRYSKLEFLFAVSHCSDITETLSEENSDTEDYSWDESDANDSTNSANSHSSAASAVPVASASTSSDNVCDICWANPRAKIVFVPCGHARFCDSCARELFATTKKCGICRHQIDLLLPVFN